MLQEIGVLLMFKRSQCPGDDHVIWQKFAGGMNLPQPNLPLREGFNEGSVAPFWGRHDSMLQQVNLLVTFK